MVASCKIAYVKISRPVCAARGLASTWYSHHLPHTLHYLWYEVISQIATYYQRLHYIHAQDPSATVTYTVQNQW